VKILFVGDIFASPGRRIAADHLQDIRKTHGIDLAIANAENSAGGFGVTPAVAQELLSMGFDVLTGGNHSFDKREIYDYMDRQPLLLRPANIPTAPGQGIAVVNTRSGIPCAVLNLQGRTFMASIDCPFRKADELLASLDPAVKVRLVDFHAEVTSEKMALGWYLDGRVSAVVGTHTHVPTADTRVLPGGTAYQTDVGMTGPYDSIIGVEKQAIINRFLSGMPARMEPAKGMVELHSVIVDIDEHTGLARSIERHTVRGD
jgi:2',3'-cyclic-nucleotide 2'-phosphodiesterase